MRHLGRAKSGKIGLALKAAALTMVVMGAACVSRPADHLLSRTVSPDGSLEAVTMICPNPADRTARLFVGAVYRKDAGDIACKTVAASPAVQAWFDATLLPDGVKATDTVTWTADNRAIFDVAPREVRSRTTAAEVDESVMQVRTAKAPPAQ